MKKEYRSRKLTFYCPENDLAKIHEAARKTTCQSLSEYMRKVLLGQPVAIAYRNRSLDELIDRLADLQTELEMVRKLESIGSAERALLQEIKLIMSKIADHVYHNKTESKSRKGLTLP